MRAIKKVSRLSHRILARAFGLAALLTMMVAPAGCVAKRVISDESYKRSILLVERGVSHLRVQQFDTADAAFSLAYELAPLAAALDGRGCVALVRGDYREAERLFLEAYQTDRTYDHALGNLALLYEITGRKEEAIKWYRVRLQQNGADPAVRHNLAALEFDMAQQAGAAIRHDAVLHEFLKSRALSDHGVIRENIDRLLRKTNHGK